MGDTISNLQIRSVVRQSTEPTGDKESIVWIDTSVTPSQVKTYDTTDSSWKTLGNTIDDNSIVKLPSGDIAVNPDGSSIAVTSNGVVAGFTSTNKVIENIRDSAGNGFEDQDIGIEVETDNTLRIDEIYISMSGDNYSPTVSIYDINKGETVFNQSISYTTDGYYQIDAIVTGDFRIRIQHSGGELNTTVDDLSSLSGDSFVNSINRHPDANALWGDYYSGTDILKASVIT